MTLEVGDLLEIKKIGERSWYRSSFTLVVQIEKTTAKVLFLEDMCETGFLWLHHEDKSFYRKISK